MSIKIPLIPKYALKLGIQDFIKGILPYRIAGIIPSIGVDFGIEYMSLLQSSEFIVINIFYYDVIPMGFRIAP